MEKTKKKDKNEIINKSSYASGLVCSQFSGINSIKTLEDYEFLSKIRNTDDDSEKS